MILRNDQISKHYLLITHLSRFLDTLDTDKTVDAISSGDGNYLLRLSRVKKR